MKNFHNLTENLKRQLALAGSPVAVRMLRTGEGIPEGARRPRTDFGICLAQCQVFSLAERSGMSMALLKEDMWCPEPVLAYGLEATPEHFLEGHTAYPSFFETPEASANWASKLPRLETGKYIGIVSAPLADCNFEPDLVLIFCNSIQLMCLLAAVHYKDGNEISSRLSSMAGCVYPVVQTMQTGQPNLGVPCPGFRRYGGVQNDTLLFAIPGEKLEDTIYGLAKTAAGKIPPQISMRTEYMPRESYAESARQMGMKKADGSEIVGKPAGQERLPWE